MAYTIKEITRSEPWVSKYGNMVSYYMTVVDSAGIVTSNVKMNQKAETPAPAPGQVVEGNLDNGTFGLELKKAYAGGGAPGGGGRPKSPGEQASITASVALKWAVEAVDQAATFGTAPKPETLEEHVALLRRYADWGCKYIESKVAAA